MLITRGIIIVCYSILFFTSTITIAEDTESENNLEIGRYVAIQPPSAGERTFVNFLWVLDTATGNIVGHKFSEVKDEKGQFLYYVTEQLLTEYQHYAIVKGQNPSQSQDQ